MKKSGLYSHPNRFLEDHIKGVCDNALSFCDRIDLDENMKKLLLIIAFSHDLGKSTSYFQRYIKGEKVLKTNPLTKHALLGGVAALHLAQKEGIKDPFQLALAFLLPKRHHGDLHSFDKDLLLSDEQMKILQKQIASIDKMAFSEMIKNVGLFRFSWEDIDLTNIKKSLRQLKIFFKKDQKDLHLYLHTLTLFSLLIDSDKMDAAFEGKKVAMETKALPEELVERYLQSQYIPPTPINHLRNEAFKEVMEHPIDANTRVYDITLPTGMGKTLISFAFALKLAKAFSLNIVYSLPFLSIIEQNYAVIKDVLEKNGIEPTSDVLLKHHHLADLSYETKEDEFDYDKSRILVEGWNSKIVVTTFIQFFHTIIGHRNKMVRKFHRLSRSVVILDEVQSIPIAYWKLIRAVLEGLAKRFSFFIIFVTATQPMICTQSKALVGKRYFRCFHRYRICTIPKRQSIEEFLDSFKIDKGSHLFILNTISEAKSFYDRLSALEPLYLSTHIVPKERKRRIEALKTQKIAISTQLIEAGVDVDFDIVVRDMAPLDSIIQSAGRCNREMRLQEGNVIVTELVDEKGRLYASYIYDSVLLSTTKEILETKRCFSEEEVLEKITNYFTLLQKRKSFNESQKMLESLLRLDFDRVKEFRLIQERIDLYDVFIQMDVEGEKIWQKFCEIMQIEDILKRKQAFDKIKVNFYDYVISVPIKENEPPIECNHYVVYRNDLKRFYDQNTGFITRKSFEIL